MICQVCGGTESYIHDGTEYCQECSVQFKSSQDENLSDESFSRRTLQSTPDIPKAKKGRRTQFSPWISVEAYNLILCKQVSALMKLGCSHKLKDIVLYIWAKYLQKCETAFIKEHYYEKNKPRLSLKAMTRDKKVLYGEGTMKRRRKAKKNLQRKSASSHPRKKPDKISKDVVAAEIASDTETTLQNFTNDQELEIHSSSESSFSVTNNEEAAELSSKTKKKESKNKVLYSSHARKIMKSDRIKVALKGAETCVHNMTLNKTLSFCHLGLLYTEDQFLLTDLVRLVNDGTIPFIDVTCYFPSSMQLQNLDHCHFNKNAAPEISNISLTSAKLIDFLKLPKFKQHSVLSIAVRFVKDLNLPDDIIPVLKLLNDKLPERNDRWFDDINTEKSIYYPIPIYELRAASLIAVALKMLFVLDGKYEVEHSEVMMKLNSITEENKFFVWNEWEKQTSLKEYLFMKKEFLHNDISRLDSLIADRIIERYPLYGIRPELHQLVNIGTVKDVKARYQTKILLDDLIGNKRIKKKATSFPLRHELSKLMREWKELHLFKDTSDIDFDFISKDFSNHKLFYKPSTCCSDRLTHLLLSSLYESVELHHFHIDNAKHSYHENIIRTSSKYWHLDSVSTHSDCKENWVEKLPSSFKWLLKFLCKYLQIDHDFLSLEIKYVEKKLFVQK